MTADSGASNVHAEYVGEGMIIRERGREMSFSIAHIGANTQSQSTSKYWQIKPQDCTFACMTEYENVELLLLLLPLLPRLPLPLLPPLLLHGPAPGPSLAIVPNKQARTLRHHL